MKIIFFLLSFVSFAFVSTANALSPSPELAKIMSQKFYTKNLKGEQKPVSRAEAIVLAHSGAAIFTTLLNGNEIQLKKGSSELQQVISDNQRIERFKDLSKRLYGR